MEIALYHGLGALAEPEFTPNNVETRDQRTKLVYQIRVHLPADAALKPGQPVDVTLP